MRYVNYGNGVYDLDKWREVKNYEGSIGWIKPGTGGLWSSPVDSKWGWKDWCEAEDYDTDLLDEPYFEFSLKEDSNIYVINSVHDLKFFKYCNLSDHYRRCVIDFERAAREYDAIFLTMQGEQETRYSDPYSLYGWDCETLLVLNKDSMIDIKNYII
jgi:hypothetical protein